MLVFRKFSCVLVAGLLVFGTAPTFGDISNVVLRIEAENDAGSGFIEFTDGLTYIPALDAYSWSGSGTIFAPDFTTIAVLEHADMFLRYSSDPRITGSFSVISGLSSETTFKIWLAELDFPTIPDALTEGAASFTINGSDTYPEPPNQDGIDMWKLPGSNGIFRTGYNDYDSLAEPPTGMTFADDLMEGRHADAGGSLSGTESYPDEGYADVVGDVYNMTAQIGFTLTPGDTGGGTFVYEILPEPSTLGLVMLGAVAMFVRRR